MSDEYAKVIPSARWKNLRLDVIKLRGPKCERCAIATHPRFLTLHHKTYEHLGAERLSELEVLCEKCHRTADVEREDETDARLRAAVWSTPAWAGKYNWWWGKYGNDWAEWHEESRDKLRRQFENWCIERMTGRIREKP